VINLKNPGRTLATSQFAFVGNDRVAGFNPDEPNKSGIFTLPGGELVEQFRLPTGQISAATEPNMLLVRPSGKSAVGVFDLGRKAVTRTNVMEAFDAFGAVFATERETGHVGVFAAAGDTLIKDVAIPAGELGHVRAAAISKDFQWLAVSGTIARCGLGSSRASAAWPTSAVSMARISMTADCFLRTCRRWPAKAARSCV
jgi:hypothetical protein